MPNEQTNHSPDPGGSGRPSVNTGNASNPAPQDDSPAPSDGAQLLDEKAEKYLREVASIEDVPDARDQQEMNEVLKKENER